MRGGLLVVLVAGAFIAGCSGGPGGLGGGAEGPVEEARALIEQGDYDGALARLGSGEDPESLYLFGRAWAGKAAAAGAGGPGAGLGPEELRALDFLERAIAARPDHAGAHLAVAELLAPHVPAPGTSDAGASAPDAAPGPVVTADRVLGEYGAAVQADPADKESVEALIRFAIRMERPRDAEAGFQELTKRDRENPDLLVRFGDFLVGPGGDSEAALGVYAQAVMWRPDDSETRLKMADIHIAAAQSHLNEREFVAAERRLREARKNVVDPGSPQASELRRVERELADVSGRR
jgi:tetratricopeptide (TPR) repeat protein